MDTLPSLPVPGLTATSCIDLGASAAAYDARGDRVVESPLGIKAVPPLVVLALTDSAATDSSVFVEAIHSGVVLAFASEGCADGTLASTTVALAASVEAGAELVVAVLVFLAGSVVLAVLMLSVLVITTVLVVRSSPAASALMAAWVELAGDVIVVLLLLLFDALAGLSPMPVVLVAKDAVSSAGVAVEVTIVLLVLVMDVRAKVF